MSGVSDILDRNANIKYTRFVFWPLAAKPRDKITHENGHAAKENEKRRRYLAMTSDAKGKINTMGRIRTYDLPTLEREY